MAQGWRVAFAAVRKIECLWHKREVSGKYIYAEVQKRNNEYFPCDRIIYLEIVFDSAWRWNVYEGANAAGE